MMGEGGGFSEGPLTITEVTVKRSHGGGLFDDGVEASVRDTTEAFNNGYFVRSSKSNDARFSFPSVSLIVLLRARY